MDYDELYVNTIHLNKSKYAQYPIVNLNKIHVDTDSNIYIQNMLDSLCIESNINKSYFIDYTTPPDNFVEMFIMKLCVDNLIKLGISNIDDFTIEYIFRNKPVEKDEPNTNEMIYSNKRNAEFEYTMYPFISTFLFIDESTTPCIIADLKEYERNTKSIRGVSVLFPGSLNALTFFTGIHIHNLSHMNIIGKYIEIIYWYKKKNNSMTNRLSCMNNSQEDMQRIQNLVFLQIPNLCVFDIKQNITNKLFDSISESNKYDNKDLYDIMASFDIAHPFTGIIVKKKETEESKLYNYKHHFSPCEDISEMSSYHKNISFIKNINN